MSISTDLAYSAAKDLEMAKASWEAVELRKKRKRTFSDLEREKRKIDKEIRSPFTTNSRRKELIELEIELNKK